MTPLSAPSATPLPATGAALPAPTPDHARAAQQAQEFESVFLSTMLSQMFAGLETDGPFHGGHAEQQFRGFLVEEYANAIAQSGGIGLADAVARELIAIQEESGK
ncbi:MAG: rod-binding protein [Rhodobiaceae bacterium]|nr:rod-binding protein [Rhodobiaceae bacterium]